MFKKLVNFFRGKKDIETKSSQWGDLWKIAQEHRLFGSKVVRPYEEISNVYKAIKAIADNVPQADLKFYNKKTLKEIESDAVIDLFNKPNPLMSESDFIQAWVGFHCLYGESIIIKEQSIGQAIGSKNLPAELWVFNPKDFKEKTEGRQILGWRYNNILFTSEQVVFMKDFNPYNFFRGITPIKPLEKIIDIDWQSLLFNKAFFDNDATPSMVLSTDQRLTDDQYKRLEEWWEKRHKGATNAFKVAVMSMGLKPTVLSPTHKEMDFIEQKRFTREEILGIWRAPKALFNITEDLNYATFMGQMKIFWNYSIMPVLKKIEDKINIEIVMPYNPAIVAKFDYSNVVAYQEDFKEKILSAKDLFAMGFTANEVNNRLQLGFDEKPWRDYWWIPFGMTPAGESIELAPEEEKTVKLIENKDDVKNLRIWRQIISKQTPIEDRMASVIKKYFYEQRKEVLDYFNKNKSIEISWEEQKSKLTEKTKHYIWLSIKEGVIFGQSLLGRKSIDEDAFDRILQSYLALRTDRITMIVDTVRNRIKSQLEEGIQAGETIMELSDRIRNEYNMATSRSLLIARTETIGALNGGSLLYYENEGIKFKEWLTAGDELVRDSHRACERQGAILMNERFINGLRYPGDQDGGAGEVCNCRCSLLPVIK